MPAFCDVALPVPLDQNFSYRLDGMAPPVGVRVVVPFRNTKLIGVVVRLHDDDPGMQTKPVETVLDPEPILTAEIMELAVWISRYYLAPLGEVLRTALPLMAEVRRTYVYRITETGQAILFSAAQKGSSNRSRQSAEDQQTEYAVLEYLSSGESASRATLQRATGVSPSLLFNMVRKKWLLREAAAAPRDARRVTRYAVLRAEVRTPKLNERQLAILAELAGAGGSLELAELRQRGVPYSTLQTLVRRDLIVLEERPAAFHVAAPGSQKPEHVLNRDQQGALTSILHATEENCFSTYLLHGVTGSGKTAVYLAAMQHVGSLGRSALLLVPEIGLTPAMAAQVYAVFGSEVALLHSALTADERAEQWRRIRGGEARMVVGTRSAIFAPLEHLGLIIVDEEHDSSYKQEETPRYHARDVAVMRGKISGAVVVLGSATPSLESWRNTETGKYHRLEMLERVNRRPLPVVDLVDMRREFQETGQESLFSRTLTQLIGATLNRGEQAIVLLNRRGYSFAVLCRSCGEKLQCENCAIALTHHKSDPSGQLESSPAGERLKCHYCGYARMAPRVCPHCESEHLFYLGAGSQQGEERLLSLFPQARIGRMDRDTVRSRRHMEELLASLHSGRINLLVGTQMIAKGHDIHGVTLVGVVGADYALGLPDFRAGERTFQLLTQASGRAGRGELTGQVVVQTYHPEHYAIQSAMRHDFLGFARQELRFRKLMHYPPFCVLANILVHSPRLEEAAAWSEELGKWFAKGNARNLRVLGPATAPIARIKRSYRFHLVLKGEKRGELASVLRAALAHAQAAGIPRRNLIVDVDAMNLM